VEKRTDSLFAKLESIRGILDRIAHSQTDKMVRGRREHQLYNHGGGRCCKCVLTMFVGYARVSGRSVGPETFSEVCDCGTC